MDGFIIGETATRLGARLRALRLVAAETSGDGSIDDLLDVEFHRSVGEASVAELGEEQAVVIGFGAGLVASLMAEHQDDVADPGDRVAWSRVMHFCRVLSASLPQPAPGADPVDLLGPEVRNPLEIPIAGLGSAVSAAAIEELAMCADRVVVIAGDIVSGAGDADTSEAVAALVESMRRAR